MDGELSLQEIQSYSFAKHYPLVQTEVANLGASVLPSGKIFLHLNLKKEFSKEVYEEMLHHFSEVCVWFKEKGITHLFICIPYNEKLVKFEGMFGFKPTQVLHTEEGDIKLLIMRRDL